MKCLHGRPLLRAVALSVGLAALCGAGAAAAEEAAAQTQAPASDLETLVGPVALYPDDLLSIVLPASTFPLQIVEADRWLAQNKGNKDAKPKETWDDSVKSLLNYPDVVTKMSTDLEWTSALGEAVATDQTAVMDAVQSFRRKAEGAGNLKSDDKQVVVVEKEVVKIVQADPEVIYVPQYQPTTVIVQQPAPVYPTYYPTPYPVYYYPYPPGAAFAAGLVWGATMAYAFDWHGGGIHNDIDIDIDRNVNIDRSNVSNRSTNIDRSRSQQMQRSGQTGWQSKQRPSDVRQGRAPTASTRTQGAGASQRAGASQQRAGASQQRAGTSQQRAGASQQGAGASQRASSSRPSASTSRPSATTRSASSGARYDNAARASSTARSSPPSRNAMSGMSSSRSVGAQSARGASSRSMSRGGGGGRRR
jgi:hypothetical protein